MNFTRRQFFSGIGAPAAAAAIGGYLFSRSPLGVTTAQAQGKVQSRGQVDPAQLQEPGPLGDMILGSEDAPVTIVEYASVTCGACAAFHTQTFPALKEKYIETGKVRLILREFPTQPAQVAIAGFMLARCSGDRYFPVIDTLFEQFNVWGSDPYNGFMRIARQAGMSQERFEACLKDQELASQIQDVARRGHEQFNVDSTPTFFINGTKYVGVLSIEQMETIIEPLL